MQREQIISRSVATERLQRRLRAAGVVGAILFVTGLFYVVERGAAFARAQQAQAEEQLVARLDLPPGFTWMLVAGAAEFSPLPGQKQAPCASYEKEVDGFCWHEAKGAQPPCAGDLVEQDGECWAPTPGVKKKGNGVRH